jgi:hypothetical protein
MNENSQQLKKEIVEKNMILDSFSQNYDSDREHAQNVKAELDGLLYQYYKMLKYKEK